jgi:hypothetical protein
MFIISNKPNLIIHKQSAKWDNLSLELTVEAYTSCKNLSVNQTFDCSLNINDEKIIDCIDTKISSIEVNGVHQKSISQRKIALIKLTFTKSPKNLVDIIKNQDVMLGIFDDLTSNIYVEPAMSIKSIKGNVPAERWLKRLTSNNLSESQIFLIGRATHGKISIGQDFDTIWDLSNNELVNDCDITLEQVLNNRYQKEKTMINIVPYLIKVEIKTDCSFFKSNRQASCFQNNSLMIGKKKDIFQKKILQ